MLNSLRPAFIIAHREVRDQLRDWRIIFPVIALTVFFPFLMNFTAQQILGFVEKYGATILGERLVPFLLMIVGFFPISVSLVIALESFVGEKERGSIEPLLNAPLSDWQLYLGKLLSSTVPPLLSSYLGMGVYLAGLAVSHVRLPEFEILAQVVILTTIQAVMMVSGAVVVSSQATSVRAANLLASFIVIPVALLIQGESVVMFWGNQRTLWWVVFGLIIVSALLVRVGLAHFQREELLGREIDILNVRWMWNLFVERFMGGASSLFDWYRKLLQNSWNDLKIPLLMSFLIGTAGFLLGILQVNAFKIPLDEIDMGSLDQRLQVMIDQWSFSVKPVFIIWWQNVRAMLVAMALGSFSLGVLGMLPLLLSLGVAGYLLELLAVNGLSVESYIAFVIPHGIVEIPAVLLATAAVLRAGAVLATPNLEKTVGEVWIESLADWCRVMVGLVVPLLFISACIEAWVTPRVVMWFFY